MEALPSWKQVAIAAAHPVPAKRPLSAQSPAKPRAAPYHRPEVVKPVPMREQVKCRTARPAQKAKAAAKATAARMAKQAGKAAKLTMSRPADDMGIRHWASGKLQGTLLMSENLEPKVQEGEKLPCTVRVSDQY